MCTVSHMGKKEKVKTEKLIRISVPKYEKGDFLLYFIGFQPETQNNWTKCEIVSIKKTQEYVIEYKQDEKYLK